MKHNNAEQLSAKEIFILAAGLKGIAERQKILDEYCGANSELRKQVDRLLAAADQGNGGSPLDAIVDAFGPEETLANLESDVSAQQSVITDQTMAMTSIKVGSQIGRYRLMEQLGEGGMGVVYVAEQLEPVRRKVALKVIKPGMDSKQVIARFEAERQALALMDHVNIARVLDGGTTEQGLPYFVMELVRGLPITEYCDQAKATTRDRLALFMTVCNAVHHAHQKGIIHRDIKPGNVLVTLHDGKPVVKVIDFGVAKALHQQLSQQTVYTALNQVVGTPLYMSPEQLELSGLDIDIRTDVYSLGVLLYELLTGTPPFDRERLLRSGFDEMRRIIREEEPPRPSQRITTLPKAELSTCAKKRGFDERTFSKSIQNELDWITLKALEKDRNRRYESSSALAADVQRYLDDEQVLACPPSVAYRVKKFIRRHRVLLTTTALVLVSSIVGTSVSIWQAIRANESKQVALASNAIAKQAVDDMYTQFAEKWLAEEGNASELQREFLEKAAAFYEANATQLAKDPTYALDQLKSRKRVCDIQIQLGQYQEAEAGLRNILQICRQRRVASPSLNEYAIIEFSSIAQLGSLLSTIGKKDEAKSKYEEATILLREIGANSTLDTSHKSAIATVSARLCTGLQIAKLTEASEAAIKTSIQLWKELLATGPSDWHYRAGLAKALERQGLQRMWFGDRKAEAKTAFLESNEMLLQLLKERPRDRTCRQTLVRNYLHLGVLASWAGQLEQKMAFEREGMELAQRLIQDYPGDQEALSSMNTLLGNNYSTALEQGSLDDARVVLKLWHESSEKLVDLFPTVISFVRAYSHSSVTYSRDLYKHGEHTTAISIANRYKERLTLIKNQESEGDITALNTLAFDSTLDVVALLLEEGLYTQAIQQLEDLNFEDSMFNSQNLDPGPVQYPDMQFLLKCNDAYWDLHRPITMIRECVELVERDQVLTIESKRELTKKLRPTVERCEAESRKLHDAWLGKLGSLKLTSDEIRFLYVRFMEEDTLYSTRVEKRLQRETSGRLAIDLVRKMDNLGQDAKPNDLSLLIGELTAGEEHIRDPILALRLAERAIAMQPDSELARQDLSWALFRNGRYEESLGLQGSKIPRTSATQSQILAMTLWHLGRKEEAAACLAPPYEQKLSDYIAKRKKDPDGKLVWPTAANLIRLDREAKALLGDERTALATSFADAEVQKPTVESKVSAKVDPINALRAIAKWQFENHRVEEAEESISEVIRLQPDSADRAAWKARGDLRLRAKRFEEALSDLNYFLETTPDDAVVLFHRCYCYRDLNRFPEALSDANRLIELAPTGYRRWLNRAELYEKMKQPEQALADIQKAMEVCAGKFDPWYEVSEVFALRGRIYLEGLADSEQAIADLTHALEQNLFSGKQFSKRDAYLLRATAYDLLGDSEKANQDRTMAASLKR